MLSRRAVILGGLAASAGLRTIAQAQNPPAGDPGAGGVPRTVFRLQRRTVEVNGKPASVYGIQQPDGTFGLTTDIDKPFRVRVENRIDEPSLIHWHGLTPPWQQDGVPGVSGPPIPAGGSADYDFPLRFGGTFWMHSHQGLQEQSLMVAPLIIHDERYRGLQEVVVMLGDFSFTPPQQIFEQLKKPKPMAQMAGGAGAGAAAAPDLNDVKYDAFLANYRTLADPEVVKVEPGGQVLLRIINSSSMSAYHIDLGQLDGELTAVDGFAVMPVTGRNFPIAVAQRLDIRVTIPGRRRGTFGSRPTGRGAQPDWHRAGSRKRPHRAHSRAGRGRFTRAYAGSGEPVAGGYAAGAAQGRPRAHDKLDRRYGEIHLVAQQCRMDPGGAAVADRQRRAR
jgi:FtsP/CotA-like multicopper oxidase with cupredoxin domain